MDFPNEIWILIKDYFIHNILKHGKHLKNDKWISIYNQSISQLYSLIIPRCGPRIIYYEKSKKRFIKILLLFATKI